MPINIKQVLPNLQSLDDYLSSGEKEQAWDEKIRAAVGGGVAIINSRGDGNCGPRAAIQAILLDGFTKSDKTAHIAYLNRLFERQYQRTQNINRKVLTKDQFFQFIQSYEDCNTFDEIKKFCQKYFNVQGVDDIPIFYLAACLRFDIDDYWKKEAPEADRYRIGSSEYETLNLGENLDMGELAEPYFVSKGINFDVISKQDYGEEIHFISARQSMINFLNDDISTLQDQKAIAQVTAKLKTYRATETAPITAKILNCGAHYVTLVTDSTSKALQQRVHAKTDDSLLEPNPVVDEGDTILTPIQANTSIKGQFRQVDTGEIVPQEVQDLIRVIDTLPAQEEGNHEAIVSDKVDLNLNNPTKPVEMKQAEEEKLVDCMHETAGNVVTRTVEEEKEKQTEHVNKACVQPNASPQQEETRIPLSVESYDGELAASESVIDIFWQDIPEAVLRELWIKIKESSNSSDIPLCKKLRKLLGSSLNWAPWSGFLLPANFYTLLGKETSGDYSVNEKGEQWLFVPPLESGKQRKLQYTSSQGSVEIGMQQGEVQVGTCFTLEKTQQADLEVKAQALAQVLWQQADAFCRQNTETGKTGATIDLRKLTTPGLEEKVLCRLEAFRQVRNHQDIEINSTLSRDRPDIRKQVEKFTQQCLNQIDIYLKKTTSKSSISTACGSSSSQTLFGSAMNYKPQAGNPTSITLSSHC